MFNDIMESGRIPEEWRKSVRAPVFKKGVHSYNKHKDMKLMSHKMKGRERSGGSLVKKNGYNL